MAYSGFFVFGDSLVDAGNALKLAEVYDDFPFASLPDGAPTSDKGYHSGNFTNGWTFADLICNKYLAVTTKSVFPFGFNDPLGIYSDPSGNNLNFAYGGGQIRQGEEVVPDMDDQTDAYRDAVDGDADPNALHLFVFGANDVHDLVPKSGSWANLADATSALQKAANEYIEELLQTIDIGARHILATGVPDIGIQPYYNGSTDEASRRAVATEYAGLLDSMIQAQLYKLQIPGVEFHFVPWDAMADSVLGTMAGLYGEAEIYPLNLSNEVFFDKVHPTAQVHALAAAYMIDMLDGPAGNQIRLTAPDYAASGGIATKGEIDTITVSLAANTSYGIELLGISTLGGNVSVLADPMLKIFGPGGTLVGSNDDGGLGLDASLTFTSGAAGDYVIQLSGVGSMTGSYLFQAASQATGNNSYSVSHAGAIILERAGGGFDTVAASVSYALNSGAEAEVLRTANDKGKGAINLTGNEFGQTIVGNAGNNVIEGKGGADTLTGGTGKDVFVLSNLAVTNPGPANIDKITDYGSGDIVDIGQILHVAAGTNVVAGQYLRVTTNGLVQVDVDGGGNGWTTLSTINNGGAVSVSYLSGGAATTVSVSRTAANSNLALASAVAASGLMAGAAAAATASPDHGDLLMSGAIAAGGRSFNHDASSVLRALPGETRAVVDEDPAASTVQNGVGSAPHGADSRLTPQEIGSANISSSLLAGTDDPGHGDVAAMLPQAAYGVAMPSAKVMALVQEGLEGIDRTGPLPSEIAQVVADALGSQSPVDALLDALPGTGKGQAAAMESVASVDPWSALAADPMNGAFEVQHFQLAAQHPDAFALI